MSSMANITVKKNDGTTDIVYTALSPSAGDTVPALWRANSVSTIPLHRPSLTMVTQNNQAKNARKVRIAYNYPVTAVISGVETKLGVIPLELNATLGTNFDDTIVAEAVSQFGNLAVSALIRLATKEGFAPT